jgi:hypothetical protein
MRSCNTFADFFPFRDFSRIFSILAAKLRWAEARSAPFCVSMSLKRGERAAGPKPRSDYITIKSSLRLSAKCTCRKLVQLFTPSTGENCSTLIVGEWRAGEIMVQECVKRNILLLLSIWNVLSRPSSPTQSSFVVLQVEVWDLSSLIGCDQIKARRKKAR